MQYDKNGALLKTEIKDIRCRRGKVRDIYDLGDTLLLVATDRISAFDVVMPNGIPAKGKVLTQISMFWFDFFDWMPNHIITGNANEYPSILQPYKKDLEYRSVLVKKATPLSVECVVRGYITGSGWKDYRKTGSVCGIKLREGYKQAEKLDKPLFTPATKAELGEHDENITFEDTVKILGKETANKIRDFSIKLYSLGSDYAKTKGIILADTKFEFGIYNNNLILIDEVLTPDSSRFWPEDQYKIGISPPSLDKQFVRDYLETLDWNKTAPGPELPDEIVEKTKQKYIECYETLTGKSVSGF